MQLPARAKDITGQEEFKKLEKPDLDLIRKSAPFVKVGRFRYRDYTGLKFNMLTAVSVASGGKRFSWVWKCDCGTVKTLNASPIYQGKTVSCGCYNLKNIQRLGKNSGKHYLSKTPEYLIWSAVRQRCSNKNNSHYKYYGAIGITVCDRWKDSFENFYADMGTRPSPKHSIDRINVNGNYEPSNCRWATAIEQANNKSTNVIIPYKGREYTAKQLSEILKIPYQTLLRRITFQKLSPEEAVFQGSYAGKKSPAKRKHLYKGEYFTLKELAVELGTSASAVYHMHSRGSSVDKIIKHYEEKINGTIK